MPHKSIAHVNGGVMRDFNPQRPRTTAELYIREKQTAFKNNQNTLGGSFKTWIDHYVLGGVNVPKPCPERRLESMRNYNSWLRWDAVCQVKFRPLIVLMLYPRLAEDYLHITMQRRKLKIYYDAYWVTYLNSPDYSTCFWSSDDDYHTAVQNSIIGLETIRGQTT